MAIVSVPALVTFPPRTPPLHSLVLPEADMVPVPFTVPLANVKSPVIVSALLTVNVPPQVLSMSTAPTVVAISMIAVP